MHITQYNNEEWNVSRIRNLIIKEKDREREIERGRERERERIKE